jgi:hypothetical protein
MDETDLRTFWADMKETVRSFRKEDRRRIVFGARRNSLRFFTGGPKGGHDYRILPIIPDAEILAFERRNGIDLPPEYSTYLVVFGAGGAGPNYGIEDFNQFVRDRDFTKPFPYRESLPEDYYELPTYDSEWSFPGLAYISDLGCGCEGMLELNGPQPGTIWHQTEEGFLKQCSFANYYLDWATRTRRSIDSYAALRAFARRVGWFGSYSGLMLDEVLAAVTCEHHKCEGYSFRPIPEGEIWVKFSGVHGKVVADVEGAVKRIDLY